jgi:hypothetical protein
MKNERRPGVQSEAAKNPSAASLKPSSMVSGRSDPTRSKNGSAGLVGPVVRAADHLGDTQINALKGALEANETHPVTKLQGVRARVARSSLRGTGREDLTATALPDLKLLSVGEAALVLAFRGFAVFPLGLKKRPLANCPTCTMPGACPGRDECICGVGSCHGFYAATTDQERIKWWWARNRWWQVGIRTGAASRIVALDVDLDKGGLDSLIALRDRGVESDSPGVQLSGGGRSFHLFYRHPGGVVPCSQGKLGPGLDVRADGGYIVGSPSRHPRTDQPYEFFDNLTGLPIWPLPADAPADRSRPPARSDIPRLASTSNHLSAGRLTLGRIRSWERAVRTAPLGQRRSILFWAACRMGEATADNALRQSVTAILTAAALTAGLSSTEISMTIQGGLDVTRHG